MSLPPPLSQLPWDIAQAAFGVKGTELVTTAAAVAAPALGRRWWAANGSGAWSGRSTASASVESIAISMASGGSVELRMGDTGWMLVIRRDGGETVAAKEFA